jgi:hypothetical protein
VTVKWPVRVAGLLGQAVVFVGAGTVLAGALGPWANIVVFKNIDLSVPGFFFAWGGLCLAVAILILIGARRSSILCLIGALFVLFWLTIARREVPRLVKHQVVGAQMALFPVNRLLDQFHINNIEAGDWSIPDEQVLGPGLTWSAWGGGLLLLGGALGLPSDPVSLWIYVHTARRQCRACGARWLVGRDAQFCPECGTPVPGTQRHCPVCQTPAASRDHHCIACGTDLPPSSRAKV